MAKLLKRTLRAQIDAIRLEKSGSKEEQRLEKLYRKRERQYKVEDFKQNASDIFDRASRGVGVYWHRLFSKDETDSNFVRQIAESYIEVVPVPEQRLLLTAMIAARDVSDHEQRDVRPGQFAVQVLSYMDEMGGKALQAINSHPDTPQHVKEDTKHTKSDYKKPLRWDAIDWCQKFGIQATSPDEAISYYGSVQTAASLEPIPHGLGRFLCDVLLPFV